MLLSCPITAAFHLNALILQVTTLTLVDVPRLLIASLIDRPFDVDFVLCLVYSYLKLYPVYFRHYAFSTVANLSLRPGGWIYFPNRS